MEGKLKEIMDFCNLSVFETINLAIQVASRLYPTELALHRDQIIEGLYSQPNGRHQDVDKIFDKTAQLAAMECVGSIQRSTAGQIFPNLQGQPSDGKGKGKESRTDFATGHAEYFNLRNNQQGSIDRKGKGKMQFSEKPGTCSRNNTLAISISQSGPDQCTSDPIYTRQGQSSAAKGKGKELYTDFATGRATSFNLKNNQQGSTGAKGKGKMQFSGNPGTCRRNKTPTRSILQSQQDQNAAEPIYISQGESSAAKAKGKEPCTDFTTEREAHLSSRNIQVRSNDMKKENSALVRKKVTNYCQSLSIAGGEIAKKLNSTNRGLQRSCLGASSNLILAHFKQGNANDKSNGDGETADPLY